MAPSLNFLYPPSTSPSLSFLSSSTHSYSNRASLQFKISSSPPQTIQVNNHQINTTTNKKRRKPRPSFSDQVRDKWCLKPTSLREKFPWQEQEIRQPIEEEDDDEEDHQLDSESRIGKNSLVSGSVSFGTGNRIKVAPWVQERKPRKLDGGRNSHFDSERGERENGFRGDEEEIVSTSIVEGKDAIQIGVLEKNEIFPVKIDEEVSFNGKVSKIDGGQIQKFEGSSDKFDSNLLHWERKTGSKNDAIHIGLLKKKEILPVKIDEKVSFNRKVSNIERVSFNRKASNIEGGKVQNFEGSSDKFDSAKLPWKREIGLKNVEGEEGFTKSNTMLAEKLIPEPELKRLRNVALRMVERIQIKAAGITQALVDSIHENWKVDEVVKLKFEGSSAMNMKRTHEHLESRTGGLVIWRSGSSVVLFRGMAYKLRCVQQFNKQNEANKKISSSAKAIENGHSRTLEQNEAISTLESAKSQIARNSKDLSEEELVELNELNLLLDGLGPRFTDWCGRDPVPVDADLLPSVVRGYKRPFRHLPYGIRHGLRDEEMTFFRRNARIMPPHFALGRNRELQGLAAAMVKVWERSAIAKIAIKRGVHNTCNERMAEELKILTGGTLVSRNKDYIVFYRGNDFLPPGVTKTLAEAQERAALRQDEEDQAREKASTFVDSKLEAAKGPLVAGTLAETMAATSRWGSELSSEEREKMIRESAVARHASLVRFLEKKLALAKGKIKKAEKALQKVQDYLEPAALPTDLETLTDEERFLFRKIGLSMKPYLFLGRRGIFDGTIENMHLHWKYRELVKIIVEGKRFAQVKHVAISLEAESGGVLVSVDKTTKGYAIIVYRGKNYQRPRAVKPKNLLTRRQALARSIELQRREALRHHMSELQERIEKLKSELEDMKTIEEIDEETLYSRVDDASDDDDPDYMEEVEGEEAYLETFDGGNEDENTGNEEL